MEAVTATEGALVELARLRERYGPLMLFQSCDGSAPLCLRQGELLLGPGDLLLGEVAGVPFYVDAEQYERWRRPAFQLDVAAGEGDTFSLGRPLRLAGAEPRGPERARMRLPYCRRGAHRAGSRRSSEL